MQRFPDKLTRKIEDRKVANSLRSLTLSTGLVDFCSNDYLGLSRSKELLARIDEEIQLIDNKSVGSTGSRLISGNISVIEELEIKLAEFFNSESSLFFNSGYSANLALISSISQRGDIIVYDDLVHASIRDGMRLSLAKNVSFRHNDLADLEHKLEVAQGDKFVVVESIYSMDGDVADVSAISKMCQKHNAYLIVDEAHSVGLIGEKGQGLCIHNGIENEVFARVYTFGKAAGTHGACVVGDQRLTQYLINFARAFIYTTAPSPHCAISVSCALDMITNASQERQSLNENIEYFRSQMKSVSGKMNLHQMQLINSNSAIQGVIIPGNEACRRVSKVLMSEGLDVRAILSPSVRPGSERLRICLHAYNTTQEIDMLINSIFHK